MNTDNKSNKTIKDKISPERDATYNFPLSKPGRPIERKFLIMASIILLLGIYILHQSPLKLQKDPSQAGFYIIISFWILHLFLVLIKNRGDETLLPITAFLVFMGWMVVFRLKPDLAFKQMIWIFISQGGFILWLLLVRDYRVLEDYKYIFLFAGILLQASVAIFGTEVNGAKLWFKLGFFSIQPVEIVKIFFTIFLVSYLKQNREVLEKPLQVTGFGFAFKYYFTILLLWGMAESLLIIQKDLGMTLLLFGVFMGLFYVATRKLYLMFLGLLTFAGGSWAVYQAFSHVRVRVETWLNPWTDFEGRGYQIIQSLFSLANGGLTGTGLGMGVPDYIPAVHTDYIFVAICEELGLWGGFIILGIYLVLIQRFFRTALESRKEFGSFLSLGLALLLATQIFIIVGGVVKFIPLTGITLPFISYGGSSLVANFWILAIIMQISSEIYKDKTEEKN